MVNAKTMTAAPAFRISAARLRLMGDKSCGLYAEIGYALAHVATDAVATLATDGKSLLYNPAFVAQLSDADLETALLHEYVHVALLHPVRFSPETQEKRLANVAMDYADNLHVAACGRTIPGDWYYDVKFDGMAWEAIYTLLKNEQPPQPPQPQPQPDAGNDGQPQPGENGADGQNGENGADGQPADAPESDLSDSTAAGDTTAPGKPGAGDGAGKAAAAAGEPTADQTAKPAPGKPGARNDDVQPYPAANQAERDIAAAQLSDQIMRIAQAQQMAGHGSAGLTRYMKDATTPRDPDLYQALAQLLQRAADEHTWRKPNWRLSAVGLFPGLDGDELPPLVVVVDTSSSLCDESQAAFADKIKRAVADFRPRSVTIISADDRVHSAETYAPDDLPELKFHGGGGTDFRPAFEWVADNMPDAPAALVYLTDLEGPAPKIAPDYPVIWAAVPSSCPRAPSFGQIVPLII